MLTRVQSVEPAPETKAELCSNARSAEIAIPFEEPLHIFKLNPQDDLRWAALVSRHPSASIFHTTGWLDALQRTYGYEPVVYTTTPPGRELDNGVVFCRVKSWLSGSRLVSLPFSDHCQPLVDDPRVMLALLDWLKSSQQREHWKYLELRPLFAGSDVFHKTLAPSDEYSIQMLDLRPDLDALFRGFHKSCVQRKIRRANRENLAYEEGRSEALLDKFYALLILTRRRHGIPPQPRAWFRNLLSCLGEKMLIRVVSKGRHPVASIVTVAHKNTLVYKYGCSDARFSNTGGMALLFWKAIQDAKRAGMERYDLGRSESNQPGLISFKENWGAISSPLRYYRLPAERADFVRRWHTNVLKNVFSKMPDALLTATGNLLYRHIG